MFSVSLFVGVFVLLMIVNASDLQDVNASMSHTGQPTDLYMSLPKASSNQQSELKMCINTSSSISMIDDARNLQSTDRKLTKNPKSFGNFLIIFCSIVSLGLNGFLVFLYFYSPSAFKLTPLEPLPPSEPRGISKYSVANSY